MYDVVINIYKLGVRLKNDYSDNIFAKKALSCDFFTTFDL